MSDTTMLDRAWGHALAKETDAALRLAVALVEEDPTRLGATALLARVLVAEGRTFAVADAAERLVDACVRRGDLPSAVVAARLADDAGGEGAKLRKKIAEAFGKGSKRIADVPPAPPALPGAPEIPAALAKLAGEPLLARAEKALETFTKAEDPFENGAKLPALPLFSALAPKPLGRLLGAMAVRAFGTGERLIEQGTEGREAFVVVRGLLRAERSPMHGDRATMSEPPTVLAVLGPGAIVGEMALVSDAPRAAAVIAAEPVEVLLIGRAELEAIAKDEPAIGQELGEFCRARMIANLVRHSVILRAVPQAEREALMQRFVAKTFAPGDELVAEGSETEGLFVIASGTVRVSKNDADGEPLVLAELGPGDVVGEIGIVLRRPATATVRALSATVAMELTRAEFAAAIKAHPTLLGELYQLATEREEETRTVVGQEVLDVGDVVLL
jgi:cAMP-dependent protein kinase regulator